MKVKTYIIPLLIGVFFVIVGVKVLSSCIDIASSYHPQKNKNRERNASFPIFF
ncbi:MAG: hypothetical protein ACI4K7_09395 [Oscillospiraceae bacterium]